MLAIQRASDSFTIPVEVMEQSAPTDPVAALIAFTRKEPGSALRNPLSGDR
jgi:hypothetical protein